MLWFLLLGGLLAPFLGAAFMYAWWRYPTWLFAGYLLLMPFHTLTFQILRVELGLSPGISTLLQSWKDVLLGLLLLRVFVPVLLTGRLRIARAGLWLLPLLLLYVLTGFWGVINSPSLVAGLYGFRGTFEPLIVLVVGLMLPLSDQWMRRMIVSILVVGSIVSAFAIFQVFVLGFDFLWRYYTIDGRISNSYSFLGGAFQRAMGTFSSPNQFSLYLAFLIILGVNLALRLPQHRWPLLAVTGLFTLTLLLTVSRSGWLACAGGLLISGLIWRRKTIFLLPMTILALVAIPAGFALGLNQHLANTISLRDPSAAYRFEINQRNLETVIDNPLGVGLGIVGARALNAQIVGSNGQLYTTESYYFQVAMELGIPGLLLYIALIFGVGWACYLTIFQLNDPFRRALAVTALGCVVAAIAHGLFIADLQDLTVGSYLWIMVALALRLRASEAQALTATQPEPKPVFVPEPKFASDASLGH